MWNIFKIFIEIVAILFLFFCFLATKHVRSLLPLQAIKSTTPAVEGKVLTTGTPGNSQQLTFEAFSYTRYWSKSFTQRSSCHPLSNLKNVFGCAESSLLHRLFSSCSEWGYSLAAVRRLLIAVPSLLQSTGSVVLGLQQLQHVGSVVVALGLQSTGSGVVVHGLSCSMACGIFLYQASNLSLLHWQADSLPLSHQGSPSILF